MTPVPALAAFHLYHVGPGNPNRFDTGTVELRQDRAWQKQMKPRDRALVTALTLPLLMRYHYAIR